MEAIEFFSGIGAFAEAARRFDLTVCAAFDQNVDANLVYASNFGSTPSTRNLDSIKAERIPPAELWWASPPCTPYSVRGKQRDLDDPRAVSLLNLIENAKVHKPKILLLENVKGFAESAAEKRLLGTLGANGYRHKSIDLCPTLFGVPMKRPRHYLILSRGDVEVSLPQPVPSLHTLGDFLFETDPSLLMPPDTMARYGQGFDIVDENDTSAQLICFTKNYARCMKASGSLVRTAAGVRRVSPEEILRLLGFSQLFQFPSDMPREIRWRLVGNSVDVRAIELILQGLQGSRKSLQGSRTMP